jgi:hypothetical protein
MSSSDLLKGVTCKIKVTCTYLRPTINQLRGLRYHKMLKRPEIIFSSVWQS